MTKIPRIYEVFEKRREYPRLKLDLPMQLISSNGVEADAMFFDLSPDGAQIRYSSVTAARLFGQDMSAKALQSVGYKLKTTLHDGGFSEDIQIGFLPVYQHRINNDMYSMGILFNSTDKPMLAKINNFLLYELQPEQADSGPGRESQNDTEATKKQIDHILATRLNQTLNTATHPARENVMSPGSGLDQLRQELQLMSYTLQTLHETLTEIKQRLTEIERKL